MVEQSEEDQDPVLTGYMNFLKKALRTLPDGLRAEVKARAGADPIPAPTTATTEAEAKAAAGAAAAAEVAVDVKDVGSSSTAATKAVSAVAAAAGQLVGGMWGGRAARGREEEEEVLAAGCGGGGHGLVRELVERCLFSLPHESEDVVAEPDCAENAMLGKAGLEDDEDEDDGVRLEARLSVSCVSSPGVMSYF